jgi:hypothetical protein
LHHADGFETRAPVDAERGISELPCIMSKQPLALSTIARHSLEEQARDYETIRATVMESARGRWFLEEHARRSRSADIKLVLLALEGMERLVRRSAIAAATTVGGEPLPGAHGEADTREDKRSPARPEISALAEGLQDLTSRPMPRAAPDDLLAALTAMTDEERIALFT